MVLLGSKLIKGYQILAFTFVCPWGAKCFKGSVNYKDPKEEITSPADKVDFGQPLLKQLAKLQERPLTSFI